LCSLPVRGSCPPPTKDRASCPWLVSPPTTCVLCLSVVRVPHQPRTEYICPWLVSSSTCHLSVVGVPTNHLCSLPVLGSCPPPTKDRLYCLADKDSWTTIARAKSSR
jgi:hypothetical protein